MLGDYSRIILNYSMVYDSMLILNRTNGTAIRLVLEDEGLNLGRFILDTSGSH